jgi:hypothetical protein
MLNHLTNFKAAAILVSEIGASLVDLESADVSAEGYRVVRRVRMDKLDTANGELYYSAAKLAEWMRDEAHFEPGEELTDADSAILVLCWLQTQDHNGAYIDCAVATALGRRWDEGDPTTYKSALESVLSLALG